MGRGKIGRIFVGTSGWSYEHWQDVFYPEGLAKKNRFEFFASQFSTVELNATFYHMFKESTFEKWAKTAPKDFIYAVKMWRWITHRKKLKGVDKDLEVFLSRTALLGRHLGPVLIQLPPSMHRDEDKLIDFLDELKKMRKKLSKRFRFTFEFRHKSWFTDEVFKILRSYKAVFCIADMESIECPCEITGNFIYMRFHGSGSLYEGLYTKKMLAKQSKWLKEQLQLGCDVYAYFNNDFKAHAIQNAKQLRQLLEQKT